MATEEKTYTIFYAPAAGRDLRKLKNDRDVLESIDKTIQSLAKNPRPNGAKRLKGSDQYRKRDGDYRILYEIDDAKREILICRVRDRKDVYR